MKDEILNMPALIGLKNLKDESVQTCVTSPPYYGLRDYGVDGQIGMEGSPEEYIESLVAVFSEVKRVLRNDGTLWVNIGDSYCKKKFGGSMKQKDLMGVPWMLAFALRADGWYLRQDIIWHKPNPMPESVRDRCTKSHEYLFLLSKSKKYLYDHEAIKTPLKKSSVARLCQDIGSQKGSDRVPGKTNGRMKAVGRLTFGGKKARDFQEKGGDPRNMGRSDKNSQWGKEYVPTPDGKANKKSVWTVSTKPFKGAHFAVFPPALIEPCILAGSREGDIVLDPFMGAGTTAVVAKNHNRRYLGFEINSDYIEIANNRL